MSNCLVLQAHCTRACGGCWPAPFRRPGIDDMRKVAVAVSIAVSSVAAVVMIAFGSYHLTGGIIAGVQGAPLMKAQLLKGVLFFGISSLCFGSLAASMRWARNN